MSLLKVSDLVSGMICVGFDVVMGKQAKLEKGVEQVVYRVIGRKVNENSSLPYMNLHVVQENDVYSGLTSVADHLLRKSENMNTALYAGLRSTLSSTAADYVLSYTGQSDKTLF